MNFDWYCEIVEKHSGDFQKLSELKVLYDKAKGDKNERGNLIAEIHKLYEKFPNINPSLIYKSLDFYKCDAEKFRSYWIRKKMKLCEHDVNIFNSFKEQFIPEFTDEYLSIMPSYSLSLQFTFILATPYISRDDEEFYICDNPIRKDKVFKVPMVSGGSWKGNMRWTAGKLLELEKTNNNRKLSRIQLSRLFGHENETEKRYLNSFMQADNENILRSGRLHFYPTFFDQISLEVINPHNRKTKAGTKPIYIESVPAGTRGTFSLLYVPFDLMGKLENDVKKEVANDMELICITLKEMMLTYGFSAKKSSGFGIAKNELPAISCEMNGIEIKKLPKEDTEQTSKNTFDILENKIKAIIIKLLSTDSSNSGENNA